MKHQGILAAACGLMVLSALVSAMCRGRGGPPPAARLTAPESRFAPRQRPVAEANPARRYSDALADAVEKVMPSVVVVRTERVQYKILRDFFGFAYRVPEQLAGEGSGVVVDERGFVMTSWHVVDGAKQVEVVLNDGTKLAARLVGFDRATDLAVLKIRNEELEYPPVDFGDSDALRVGEVVVAIGSPFSLQGSVTVGHVSQKGRRVRILPYEDFIQTDAAINEGNSGGPLIDVEGRLIGVNVAIKTDAQERGVGIAFAIPSNLAMLVAKSLIERGKHEWPWVGASFGTIDPLYRRQLFGGAGVPVVQVWNGTPAARAGLVPGDIVLKVDGAAVREEHDVNRIVFSHPVGSRLRFTIQRDGKKQLETELLLEEYPGVVY